MLAIFAVGCFVMGVWVGGSGGGGGRGFDGARIYKLAQDAVCPPPVPCDERERDTTSSEDHTLGDTTSSPRGGRAGILGTDEDEPTAQEAERQLPEPPRACPPPICPAPECPKCAKAATCAPCGEAARERGARGCAARSAPHARIRRVGGASYIINPKRRKSVCVKSQRKDGADSAR